MLDQPLLGFYQRYELFYETPPGTLIHQTGIQAAGEANFLMLDLDFGSLHPPAVNDREAIGRWLDQAHDRVYEGFVQSLNSELYRRLKEGEEPKKSIAEPARAADQARTELGRRLWAARASVVAESSLLLDWEGIEEEVRDRRGEERDEDA